MIELDTSQVSRCTHLIRKVYYGHYDYEVASPHPVIRLRGKYLETFGFKVGDTIEVDLQEGCIMIKKVCKVSGVEDSKEKNHR